MMHSLFLSSVSVCVFLLSYSGVLLLLFTVVSGVVIVTMGGKLSNIENVKHAVKFTGYLTGWCLIVASCLKYIFLT